MATQQSDIVRVGGESVVDLALVEDLPDGEGPLTEESEEFSANLGS